MDFYEIRYLSIFRKSVKKIPLWLKYDKNNVYFTCKPMRIYGNVFFLFFLQWEMIQTKFVKKIKTHISCSRRFFFPRKSYGLWGNVEKYGTAWQAT